MAVISFNKTDAERYGVNCAVILYYFKLSCDGGWGQLPAKDVVAVFPWMTEFMARASLQKLVAAGILEAERRGGNLDRTLYYRLRGKENLATTDGQPDGVTK